MVAGGQAHDERRHRAGLGIDGDDPGGVVAPAWRPPHALVRIAGEQPPALRVELEGEADRGTVGLEAAATRCRLAEGPGDLVPGHVEDQQIGRERVGRRELAAEGGLLVVVATARQARARLQDKDAIAGERDVGRHVQILHEHVDLVAVGDDDVLTVVGVVEDIFARAGSVARQLRGRRRGEHEQEKDDRAVPHEVPHGSSLLDPRPELHGHPAAMAIFATRRPHLLSSNTREPRAWLNGGRRASQVERRE